MQNVQITYDYSYSKNKTPMDRWNPRAICLIRNPFLAHIAMTNQGRSKNHTGFANQAHFKSAKWQLSVQKQVHLLVLSKDCY